MCIIIAATVGHKNDRTTKENYLKQSLTKDNDNSHQKNQVRWIIIPFKLRLIIQFIYNKGWEPVMDTFLYEREYQIKFNWWCMRWYKS